MSILLIILQLLPSIISAVKAIEEAIPSAGSGEEKKNLILDIIKEVSGTTGELLPAVTKVIELVVAVFNKLGVFQTTTKSVVVV